MKVGNTFSAEKIRLFGTISGWVISGPICRGILSYLSNNFVVSALNKINLSFGTKFYLPNELKLFIPIIVFFLIKKLYPILVSFLIKALLFVVACGVGLFSLDYLLRKKIHLTQGQTNDVIFILFSVFFVSIASFLYLKYFKKKNAFTIEEIDAFGGGNSQKGGDIFEHYIAGLYKRMGYHAETISELKKKGIVKTKGFDQGADVIIDYYEGNEKKRGVIQCKHYKNTVGNSAVQEVVAALAYFKADVGIIVTNNFFTPAAVELASANKVVLVDRNKLKQLIDLDKSPRIVQMLEKIRLQGENL